MSQRNGEIIQDETEFHQLFTNKKELQSLDTPEDRSRYLHYKKPLPLPRAIRRPWKTILAVIMVKSLF